MLHSRQLGPTFHSQRHFHLTSYATPALLRTVQSFRFYVLVWLRSLRTSLRRPDVAMTTSMSDASLHLLGQPSAAKRCKLCSDITIYRLVEHAKVGLPKDGLIQNTPGAYFLQHSSMEDLEASANDGCDLCGLFVNTLKGYEEDDEWMQSPDTLKGSTCDPAKWLFAIARQMPESSIKISIASGLAKSETRDGAVLVDTVVVQVRALQGNDSDFHAQDEWQSPPFHFLRFKIVARPSKCKSCSQLLN